MSTKAFTLNIRLKKKFQQRKGTVQFSIITLARIVSHVSLFEIIKVLRTATFHEVIVWHEKI